MLARDPHTGSARIGNQVLGDQLVAVEAPDQAIPLPAGGDLAIEARLLLAAGGEVTAGGTFAVTGTDGAEHVTMLHGDFDFDDTFGHGHGHGHGNDTLTLDAATTAFTAVRDSRSVLLDSVTHDAKIPGGASGTTLEFTDDSRDLVYLIDTDTMTIGTQVITNVPAPLIA